MRVVVSVAGAVLGAALVFAAPAHAGVLGDVQIKVGVSGVLPNESADTSIGGDIDISDEWVPSLQLEYFFTDSISAELLCCVATHDVAAVNTAAGEVDLGEVTHFPPTVTLKYRWTNFGAVEPYVGAGVNYTAFIDDETPPSPPGPVNGVGYDQSFGPALQVGFDYRFNDHWALSIDARRLWINTDVNIDTDLGLVTADVDIDPWVVSAAIGYRF
ncbi:MAG: OmpW family outer membrane protein [Terricaulis sp.]